MNRTSSSRSYPTVIILQIMVKLRQLDRPKTSGKRSAVLSKPPLQQVRIRSYTVFCLSVNLSQSMSASVYVCILHVCIYVGISLCRLYTLMNACMNACLHVCRPTYVRIHA